VLFTAPPAGRVIAGPFLVAVTASEGVIGVQFQLDGQNLGAEVTAAPFSITWDTKSAANGPHTLTAVARDGAGNQATVTEMVTVNNNLQVPPPAGTPPSVSITIPPSGRIIAGSVMIEATASSSAVAVQFKLDGQNLSSEVTTTPFSTIWSTTSSANGSHNVTAEARDSAGNIGVAATTVTVDNTLPAFPPGVAPLTYAFSAAKSWTSTDTSDQPRVGFGRIRSSSSVTPSGVTIIGFHQNGTLVTEAGIPASLPIRAGRAYVEFNGQVNTGLAICNSNNQDAVVSFYFTDSAGNNFGSNTLTVTANHQIVAFVNQSPFNGTAVTQATLTFTSNVPVSIAALRTLLNERNDFIVSALPIVDLQGQNSTDAVVVPHFANGGGWRSQIVLVNPGDAPLSGNVQFFGQGQAGSAAPLLTLSINGTSNSTFTYTIAPRSFIRMNTSGAGNVQVGSVRVTPDQNNSAPSISTTFSLLTNGVTVSESTVATISPGLTFRTYLQSSGATAVSGSVQTGLAIANPSSGPVDANLELLTVDGAPTGLATTVTIPSGGQIARFVRELFPQLNSSFEGVLRLKSTTPLVMTALREIINERGDSIFTSTPPVNEATFTNPEMMFPLVVSGGGYSSQFVLLSVSPEAVISGNVWLLSATGVPLN
jgi:hypothetical protein